MKKKEEGEKEENIKVKMDNWGRRRESAEMGRKWRMNMLKYLYTHITL